MTELEALKHPGFRLYYLGAVAAMNGSWMFRVLLSWAAWDITHSPKYVGVVAAASLLPVAITGPLFGALTDRTHLPRIYLQVALSLLACPAVFLLLVVTGGLTAQPLLLLSLGFGIVMSAHHPVRQSMGPRLAPASAVSSVITLSALNFNTGRLISPAIGGLLIASVGLAMTAAISVVLFVPSITVAPVLTPRAVEKQASAGSFMADLVDGLRQGWVRWPIRRTLMLSVLALGPVRAIGEILSLIADGQFSQGAEGFGLLISGLGGGALVAGLVQLSIGRHLMRRVGLRFGIIALGFAAASAMVLVPTFARALILAPVLGFASSFVGVSLQIGLQARLEDELRGRIMSLWMMGFTLSTSILSVVITAVAEIVGLPVAVLSVQTLAAIGVILVALNWGRD